MSTFNKAALAGTTLKLAKDTPAAPYLVADIYGPAGAGKTHFALTAPGPIGYALFGIKDELDGVIQKFEGTKEIMVGRYADAGETQKTRKMDDSMKKLFTEQNARFEKEMIAAVNAGARSIVIDKATDLWEAVRFGLFGASAHPGEYQRAQANMEWGRLIRSVVGAGVNLILIHEDQEEWGDTADVDKDGKPVRRPTGRRIRKGNEKTDYLIDVKLRAFREKGEFKTEVVEAKKAPEYNGLIMDGFDFATLGSMVKPAADPSVWI